MDNKVKDLFVEVKKVIGTYKADAEVLEAQERELNADLEALQAELTANLLDSEGADVTEKVYLKIRQKEIVSKSEVIDTVLEELQEEKAQLKLEYVPKLREAKGKDGKVKAEYDANTIVDKYKYLMLSEIAEIGKDMQKQYYSIAPDLMDILDDPKVNEVYRNVKYQFTSDSYKPSYFEGNKTVVHREDIRLACSGNLPQGLKAPKEKDVE